MSVSKKRERGANYTPEDKLLLAELITQHKHIIEDKRTVGAVLNKKREVWSLITRQYNRNCTTGPRQTEQLKSLYDNMKQKTRRNIGDSNIEINKTGGSWKPKFADSDVIQDQVDPLSNPCDSGAVYIKDSIKHHDLDVSSEEKVIETTISEDTNIKKEMDIETIPIAVDYGDVHSKSPSTAATPNIDIDVITRVQRDVSNSINTTPSMPSSVHRKIVKNKNVATLTNRVKKQMSTEALKRIYFKKKFQNACLETKKLKQEILLRQKEHHLKMIILKKKLDKLSK